MDTENDMEQMIEHLMGKIADINAQATDRQEEGRDDIRQVEGELEIQETSHQLEKELETQLQQAERAIRKMRIRNNRLQLENDTLKDNYEKTRRQNNAQICELQTTVSEYRSHEESLLKRIRELEQENDDLERSQRATMMSAAEFESKLNSAIEHNALFESEHEEVRAVVQRLKDEARDLRQEIKIQNSEAPDNDKCFERVRSSSGSNRLKVEMETQTTAPN
jgi:chromosome segregation ATPase